jgi:enoyl-CoA hydratase/carnithine racemase
MNPSSGQVAVEVAAGIATITLNAPDRLNAVDTEMLDAVADALLEASARADVRAIALTGAGRGFCSGAALTVPEETEGGAVDTATLVAAGRAILAVVAAPKPVVALVNGVAAGVGCSLALACDYVLATSSASFMLAFTKIGLMPDGGATALVAASAGRARAMRMALTAEKVPAGTAYEWGLIAEVVSDEQYDARSAALLTGLAQGATLAYAATKAAVNAATLPEFQAVLDREEAGQGRLLATPDFAEGMEAFFARRPGRFTGSV